MEQTILDENMKLKTLGACAVASVLLTACASSGISSLSNKKLNATPVTAPAPIVYNEPQVSAPFYALNPVDYSAPPEFEVNLYQASVAPVNALMIKADPNNPLSKDIVLDQNRLVIPLAGSSTKALKFAVLAQDDELDVTEIDDFLNI